LFVIEFWKNKFVKTKNKIRLGVNIDHVATLRQARYKSKFKVSEWAEPQLLEAIKAVVRGGAHGLTFHLREDRRHIQDDDIWMIKRSCHLPLNLEMASNPEILKIALKLKPHEVCLVPERRQEVTTEGGLDVIKGGSGLQKTIDALQRKGIKVSLFIAPDFTQIHAAAKTGAEYIEIHTGAYAEAHTKTKQRNELFRLMDGAILANSLGLKVNAGHGIKYTNIAPILKMPYLDTLNVGHSIISRSVLVGLEKAVKEMLSLIKKA
jgi:pyridoxine 5-phosphate synthase